MSVLFHVVIIFFLFSSRRRHTRYIGDCSSDVCSSDLYKANAGAITDVAGGHVEAMITPVHTAGPLVKQNRLRMLAVLSAERSPVFPSVPTLKEAGSPDLEVEVWYAMLAPAGTPQPVVARLNSEVQEILDRDRKSVV